MNKMCFGILWFMQILSCSTDDDGAYRCVSGLYSGYQKNWQVVSFTGPGADTILASQRLDLVRLDERTAKGETGFLDWDPLCDCQDPGGFALDSIAITRLNGKIFAELKFTISAASGLLRWSWKKSEAYG
jgi:hypothetical protein